MDDGSFYSVFPSGVNELHDLLGSVKKKERQKQAKRKKEKERENQNKKNRWNCLSTCLFLLLTTSWAPRLCVGFYSILLSPCPQ